MLKLSLPRYYAAKLFKDVLERKFVVSGLRKKDGDLIAWDIFGQHNIARRSPSATSYFGNAQEAKGDSEADGPYFESMCSWNFHSGSERCTLKQCVRSCTYIVVTESPCLGAPNGGVGAYEREIP